MILQDLNEIAKKGAIKPLIFWLEDYLKISRSILPKLKDIEPNITDKTIAKENLQQLIKLLEQEKPNAFNLAKVLSYVATIFTAHHPEKDRELINQYIQNCLAFQKISQQEEFYQQKRENIKSTLTQEQQLEYNKRLFNHEGMIYCLEFYLQLYKSIIDAGPQDHKWHYINSAEINFGSGNLPGLKEDFKNDEVLDKFIYYILNDDIRNTLTKQYFFAKLNIINSDSLDNIVPAFKDFITALMLAFQKIGVHQLTSFFFTPYGNKPFIKDIKL